MTPLYTGIGGVRREIKNLSCGVGGVKRELSELWAGVDGVKRCIFQTVKWPMAYKYDGVIGVFNKYEPSENFGCYLNGMLLTKDPNSSTGTPTTFDQNLYVPEGSIVRVTWDGREYAAQWQTENSFGNYLTGKEVSFRVDCGCSVQQEVNDRGQQWVRLIFSTTGYPSFIK